MYVILIYDIVGREFKMADEALMKKRNNARRIRKEVEKYLPRVQYSVFEGDIRISDLKKLKAYIKKHAVHEMDSIVIYEFERPSHILRSVIGVDNLEERMFD